MKSRIIPELSRYKRIESKNLFNHLFMKNLYDKNNNLTEEGVARMLANPFYCIEISPSVIGAHPPMISEEDFIKA